MKWKRPEGGHENTKTKIIEKTERAGWGTDRSLRLIHLGYMTARKKMQE